MKKIVHNLFLSRTGLRGGGGAGPEVSFSAKYSHGKSIFLEMIYFVIT